MEIPAPTPQNYQISTLESERTANKGAKVSESRRPHFGLSLVKPNGILLILGILRALNTPSTYKREGGERVGVGDGTGGAAT